MKHDCDVKITINCKNFDIEENIKNHVHKKVFGVCEKYAHRLTKAHIVFFKDSDGGYTSKVDLEGEYGGEVVFSAENRSSNIFDSFDAALKSSEAQVRDYKEKNLRTLKHLGALEKDERNTKQVEKLRTNDEDFLTLGDDEKDADIAEELYYNSGGSFADGAKEAESSGEEKIIVTPSGKRS